ncbi:serine hydrolase domain-containing protein [Pedobacter chitinilyticus]|uniref:Class A beta-lactamase-related serine hydrolase n=1 Tax=Pedobacter chitinilyticus TaxID=2233776 RepID=A0A3S3PUY9_9SPHI|nr:serine hydrolase domain-containing protein [Pedobacter chitinilyticus]RWU09850.1 class A beta-lactamase-related serine hydrolase [Pedobacter chitinilyticus]
MKKYSLFIFLLFTVVTSSYSQKQWPTQPFIDSYIKGEMKTLGIPGMAVAVIKDGKVLHANTYGIANIEYDIPVSMSTSFQIASVTKLFTSTLMMKWLQQKRISLDDYVTNHIPNAPETWKKITIRHLLAHESGVPWPASLGGTIGITASEPFKVDSMALLIEKLKAQPLKFETGSTQAYVNGDYFLLQYIIEKIGGLPFEQVLKKEVFDTIGMTDSGYDVEQRDLRILTMFPLKRKSQNFTTGKNGPLIFKGFYAPTSYNAGGMHLSIHDAMKWAISLDSATLITAAMQKEMAKQTLLKGGFTQLGWTTQINNGYQVIGHSGGPGLGDILRVPSEKLTIIVLSNFVDMYPYMAGNILKHYLANFNPQQMPKTLKRDLIR